MTKTWKLGNSQLEPNALYPLAFPQSLGTMAIWTGDTREPRKDEWFLSGAVIEAYQAINDMTTVYPIAKLVAVETRLEYRVTDLKE